MTIRGNIISIYSIMEYIKGVQTSVDSLLGKKYVTEVLAALLVVYSVVANHLPPHVIKAANSLVVRLLAVVVLVVLGARHPLLSVLLLVAVVVSVQVQNRLAVAQGVIMPSMTAGSPATPALPQRTFQTGSSLVARQLEGTQREVLPDPVPGMGCPQCKEVDFVPKEDQTDQVPGADQASCVQTYKEQYCIQGIERAGVQGFDEATSYSPF
jgi:hypothetical protein